MLNALIRWSLHNRPLVLALTVGLLVWGAYVVTLLPIDVLPDLTAPTVTVIVESPGMAPTEMESLVTFPIEATMNGASGVRRVRSATAVGVAIIWVEFDWGEDVYRARQTVNERLNLAAESLPAETSQPFLAPISSIMGEVLFIGLTSDRHGPLDLRTLADTVVRRRILAVAGSGTSNADRGRAKAVPGTAIAGETSRPSSVCEPGGGCGKGLQQEHLSRFPRCRRARVFDPRASDATRTSMRSAAQSSLSMKRLRSISAILGPSRSAKPSSAVRDRSTASPRSSLAFASSPRRTRWS